MRCHFAVDLAKIIRRPILTSNVYFESVFKHSFICLIALFHVGCKPYLEVGHTSLHN